jgi:hypothetical protein
VRTALLSIAPICHHDFTHDEMVSLNELSLEQPRVRQNYLWQAVAAFRLEHKAESALTYKGFTPQKLDSLLMTGNSVSEAKNSLAPRYFSIALAPCL